jgi:hypothetical protein
MATSGFGPKAEVFLQWQDLTGTSFDGEKPPPAGDALEDMKTSIRAFHSRSGDQVLHGAREKNLPGVSAGGYAGTDVHSDASHVVAFNYALTSVNTAADRQSQTANHVPDARAHLIARAGPSKVAKTPSPAVFTTRPPRRVTSLPTCC